MDDLKQSGKKFPNAGFLNAISTAAFTGFTFLADDTIFCWVELHNTHHKPLRKD
jgi:hypothetical protein